MKKIILLLFTTTIFSCKTYQDERNITEKVFLYHLYTVENFVKVGYMDNSECLYRSIEFLEKLTNIKCESTQQYVDLYAPTNQNIKSWKKWYTKNKTKIYWDETDNKMKIK